MTLQYPIENRYGETVAPTGHIRECIAASITAAKPSGYARDRHTEIRLADPTGYFLFSFDKVSRDFKEEWADNLLVALDKLGLAIVETSEPA